METILEIATQLRKRAETIAPELYLDTDLGGMCVMCSIVLGHILKSLDFDCKIVEGTYKIDYHCWVVFDKFIIDITATQFPEFKNTPITILPSGHHSYNREREIPFHKNLSGYIDYLSCQYFYSIEGMCHEKKVLSKLRRGIGHERHKNKRSTASK